MRGKREKKKTCRTVTRVLLLMVLAVVALGPIWLPRYAAPVSGAAYRPAPPMAVLEPAVSEPESAPDSGAAPPQTGAESAEEPEPVPAALVVETPVEDSYFSDAIFVGDSRTEALYLYSGLKEGHYFYSTGATVESVFTKNTYQTGKGKIPMLDAVKALADEDCAKIYLMFGVNELGWVKPELFAAQYGKVVDRVREDHPDAEVVIQSILPVSAAEDAKGRYVNNQRIVLFNGLIQTMAEEKGCIYLDVAASVMDDTGVMAKENTGDGVHPNRTGCKAWLEYLRTHLPTAPETALTPAAPEAAPPTEPQTEQ